MVAECDHPPCLVVYEFHDPYGAEANQPYTTLARLDWEIVTNTLIEQIVTFCPDHNTQEKRA